MKNPNNRSAAMLYLAIAAWLIMAVAMGLIIQHSPIVTEVYDMQPRKYYRRIYAKNGVTGYTAWLHSDPSIRQTAYNAKWDAEDACRAADLWASEFFIAAATRIDCDFEPEVER